jgi:glycerol-3-phosphate dehydrogenase
VNPEYDVIVIGAGVVGAAIARELSRFHLRTAILEKEIDVSFGTSKANSGIIHAGFHADPNTLKGALCAAGNRMFDRLSQELHFPFKRRGELMVAFTEEELRVLHFYYERGQRNKVPALELFGRERTLEMEPHLNPDIMGSLFAPTAGIICPYEYCFALVENAQANGVSLFTGKQVVRIRKKGSFFEIESADDDVFFTRYIVNAAGLFADEVAGLAGLNSFSIHPRKGEEYLLDRRVNTLVHHVIFPCPTPTSKGMLVIPTVDGPVMVGPTAEDIQDKTDFSTSRQGLRQVFDHARKMIPAIRATDAITSFAGLRPAVEGNDFIIGTTEVAGFINAAGIQSPGLTASPAIAERIRDALHAQGLELHADAAFIAERRPKVQRIRPLVEARDYKSLNSLIEDNPAYGHLVCRCENVTEAEVVDTIQRGHTTLDGIKFACRAGTGRCQGGFCTARILDILHRETGIPRETVTKKGRGSEIIPLRRFPEDAS